MEEVLLQKGMGLVVVIELSATPLKMLDPVKACILSLWTKTFLYSTAVNFAREGSWSMHFINISRETGIHKLQAVLGQYLMCRLLIYQEVLITASLLVKEKIAE
jgi:hypothetical protein